MELLSFVELYNGRKIDYDGHFGAQCVDVFRKYCSEVLSIAHTGGVEGAKDLWLDYDYLPKEKKYFKRIPKDETPKAGDAVIFGASQTNSWGHVAIVLTADDKHILVFEQDGFAQDGAKVAVRNYEKVLGFLRKR